MLSNKQELITDICNYVIGAINYKPGEGMSLMPVKSVAGEFYHSSSVKLSR